MQKGEKCNGGEVDARDICGKGGLEFVEVDVPESFLKSIDIIRLLRLGSTGRGSADARVCDCPLKVIT